MSLPLSRRIAQAALLVAAGATPLIAAGSASAGQLVPQNTDVASGISKLDGVTSASTLKGEAHQVGQALGMTGAVLAGTALPAAADATGATAATALPQTDKTIGTLGQQAGSTTTTTGSLADATGRLGDLAPLSGGLPTGMLPTGALAGGANRSMPLGDSSALPGAPSVSGVDKVVNADTVSNPVGAAGHLASTIPATSSLAGSLPTTDRLTGALPLPATDQLSALPATDVPATNLPATDRMASALPSTDNPLGSLPATSQLTGALPATGDLAHSLPAADALHLDQLSGQAGASTHRLGGLPDLGGLTGSLGGATGALQHLPGIS